MRAFWFPDTTVLRNFAVVDSLDILRDFLDGRGRWTEAIHHEVQQQSRTVRQLDTILVDLWLGDPIEVDESTDIAQIEGIRRAVFGGSAVRPLQHLGEAQTCFLLQRRGEFHDALWVTDDRDAETFAKRQHIQTLNTVELFTRIVGRGDLTQKQAWNLLARMADLDRPVMPPPKATDL